MRFANWRRAPSAMRGRAILVSLALFSIGAFSPLALAATFYKWTDQDGTVHYGDAPPKGFTGTVERVEVHPGAHTMPPPPAPTPAPNPEPGAAPAPAQPDILTQRRETRARLTANLEAARERLALAKKALAEFTGDTTGDEQYIGRQVDPSSVNPNPVTSGTGAEREQPDNQVPLQVPTQSQTARGGMFGMYPRATCRKAKNMQGKDILVCPTSVPNQEYYQRVQQLEDAVKRAQADVDDAERAYRQGVD